MNEIAIIKKEAPLVERDFVIHSSRLRRRAWLNAFEGIAIGMAVESVIFSLGLAAAVVLWM